MKRFLPVFLILLTSLLAHPHPLLASGFQLKRVGALNVDGVTYNHLWYTDGKLTFSGIALANSSVTATIDSTTSAVTADSSGNWSYGATLADGDHQVSFSPKEGSVSFTLTIGKNLPPGVGQLPSAQTPTVGIVTPTVVILFSGMFLVFSSLLLKKWSIRRNSR